MFRISSTVTFPFLSLAGVLFAHQSAPCDSLRGTILASQLSHGGIVEVQGGAFALDAKQPPVFDAEDEEGKGVPVLLWDLSSRLSNKLSQPTHISALVSFENTPKPKASKIGVRAHSPILTLFPRHTRMLTTQQK